MSQAPRFSSIRKRPHHPRARPSQSTRQGITPGRTFVQFGAVSKIKQNTPYKRLIRVYKLWYYLHVQSNRRQASRNKPNQHRRTDEGSGSPLNKDPEADKHSRYKAAAEAKRRA